MGGSTFFLARLHVYSTANMPSEKDVFRAASPSAAASRETAPPAATRTAGRERRTASRGILIEMFWRTQTTEFWVSFKTFANLPLTIGFVAVHWNFLQRHAVEAD